MVTVAMVIGAAAGLFIGATSGDVAVWLALGLGIGTSVGALLQGQRRAAAR